MKYPFRFTKSYIADINEIVSAELNNITNNTIILTFKTGDTEVVACDSIKDRTEIFEEFCKVCAQVATDQRDRD